MFYDEPWLNFYTPIVRQLAFAIASPNLIHYFPTEIVLDQDILLHTQNNWQNYFKNYKARLEYLDHHPEVLYEFLHQIKSTRLGLRFEGLLWFWLQDKENKDFRLLGHSIQTHQDGKTLGEIDFLIQNLDTQHIEHWEVCLKYYLAEPDLNIQTWIGLNPEDTFMHKLNHIVHHQFQFKHALGNHIEKRFAVIKGQLYLPKHHLSIPLWLNQQRRLGYWDNKIPISSDWCRLSRQEWICPIKSNVNINPKWWTNGLYHQKSTESFLMLKLQKICLI